MTENRVSDSSEKIVEIQTLEPLRELCIKKKKILRIQPLEFFKIPRKRLESKGQKLIQ